MARSYSTQNVESILQTMLQQVTTLDLDNKLNYDYKRVEMDRIRRESNAAALAAHKSNLRRIEGEQQSARDRVFKELKNAENDVNWPRALFLQQNFVTAASAGATFEELQNSLAISVEAKDVDALRAWEGALPAVRKALQGTENWSEFPTLARMVKDAMAATEPAALQAAREIMSEVDGAAQQYRAEIGTLSLKAAGLQNAQFLDEGPSIFGAFAQDLQAAR